MSDYTVCQYCNGYETTAGFMHEARCPLNKSTTTYYNVPLVDLEAEIARLRAELEKAERGNNNLLAEGVCQFRTYEKEIIRLADQRDEARKWARYFYRLCKYGNRYLQNKAKV